MTENLLASQSPYCMESESLTDCYKLQMRHVRYIGPFLEVHFGISILLNMQAT